MDIRKIPNDVKSLLNASCRINNFQKAIEELVYNSLDAESSSIAIRVHMPKKWIQVVDNGTGIKTVDFKLLGERYATSKLLDVKTLKGAPNKYGYQGQALANIVEVSQSVKITSRCASSDETWIKTFTEGKIMECIKVAQRPSKGTTVEINGFLFNMHIQRKSINSFNELLDIKTFLEQLTLVFHNVSISLRDDSNMEIIFKIHKNRNIYQTLLSLFEIDMADLKELQVQKNEYKVKAFIGLKESEIKNIHWIYLNNKMLYNSNIHTFVNNCFTKILDLTRKKIEETKMKGVYKKEDDVTYKSIPLYFLFLSCPYYDYDIIYSGKQTIVEFKDWDEIYKLIEKLVKVYKGDTILIDIQKNYNSNEKELVANAKDTRNEVTKIIAKFLGSHNKKPRISQMQNGVRGKRIKRRNKKGQRNNILKRIKCKTPYQDIHNINKKLPQNQDITKAPLKNCVSNNPSKSTKEIFYCKNNANQNSLKLRKSSVKCKCFKKKSNLIEKFENSTDTIKRRCDEISSNVEYLLNVKRFDHVKEASANEFVNKKLVTKSIEGEYVKNLNNSEDVIDQNYIKDQIHRHHSSMNVHIVKKLRSDDLLQTILKTQKDVYNQDIVKEDKYINTQCSNVYGKKFTPIYDFAPNLTFESHKYMDAFPETYSSQIFQISKQSRDYLNISPDMNNVKYKNTKNLGAKIRKITETQSLFTNYNLQKNYGNTDKEQLNNYKQHISKTVDISTSDVIGFSKKIRYQTINEIKPQSDNGSKQKVQFQPKTSENIRLSLNMENTYTISMESFQNSSRVFNIRKDPKTHRDEYVKNIRPHSKKCSSDKQVGNCEITEASTHKLPVCTSKSLGIYPDDEPIEPLTICEVILSSPNDNEQNVIERLNFNAEKDSLIIVECNENSDTNISKLQMKVSKNTLTGDKDFQDTTIVCNKHINGCVEDAKNETYTTHNNFTIKDRHRFIPKGMSPIFESCFSRNICSYNLDKEYFGDKIYNDFVDELAINSELFEPKVLNTNELTTGCIQNFTDKHKKKSSDLTFGSKSLKTAKVFGQVDCKFIAAKVHGKSHESSDFLVLFDQHAVHERIMLEHNLSYYFSDKNWKKVTIDAMSMKIYKNDILYLHNHKDKFTQFGLEWTVLNDSEILVNSIPEAIVGRHSRSIDVIIKSIKNLIVEQIHTIKCMKGNVSLYPKSVMDLVVSEACRYAIKFGDILSKNDCDELIVQLATCKTPFQCAHGRPVMAVLTELQPNADKYKFNMHSIKPFKNRSNVLHY